jgi:hypothetical protein
VKKNILLTCLSLASSAFVVHADPTEFEKWQKARNQAFNQFLSAQDKEFGEFLKQRWLDKKVEQAKVKPQAPKLPVAPVAPKQEAASDNSAPANIIDVKPEPEKLIKTPPVKKPSLKPKIEMPNFTFLGEQFVLDDTPLNSLQVSKVNSQNIAKFWQDMAQQKHDTRVAQLSNIANSKNLDDWGSAYLVHIAMTGLAKSKKEALLYSWYYLVQQGFDVRVGYEGSNLFLLLGMEQKVYGKKFLTLNDKRYYFVDFANPDQQPGVTVKTYQKQHQQAESSLSINLAKLPNLQKQNAERQLKFRFAGNEHELSVPYSTAYVDLLANYPQLEVEHYFDTELMPESKQALLSQLKPLLKGKSERQALNLLLRFVQKAFAYQTDDEQFQQENFLLATETLHYPYADCEDRAVLFAYLVKNLLGNDIVAVLYKGHIATAVKPNSEILGQGYMINGSKYLVADPTYIGADIGQVMPGYGKQSPKLISLN